MSFIKHEQNRFDVEKQCHIYEEVNYEPQPHSSRKLAEEIEGYHFYFALCILTKLYDEVVTIPDSAIIICYRPKNSEDMVEDLIYENPELNDAEYMTPEEEAQWEKENA